MPNLTEKERLNVWKNRVLWSRKRRETYIQRYDKGKDYYVGNQKDYVNTSLTEYIIINLIYSHIKSTLPMLYFQNPHFYVRPTRSEFKENAPLAEAVLNYYVRVSKLKREFRLSTLDALFLVGIVKTGYDPIFTDNPNKGKSINMGVDDEGNPISVIDPETGQALIEPDEFLLKELFFSKRVSPKNILFDPEYKNFVEDHNWIAEEVIERLDDVKENEYFPKNIRDQLKETHIGEKNVYFSGGSQMGEVQDDLKRIRLVHIYDFKNEKFRIYAEGQEDDLGFLYEDDTPDGMDLHPYSFLKFNEIPDEWYPLTEVEVLMPIQDEFNKARSIISDHAKKFLRKYEFESGTFVDDDEREKFKEPEAGMLIEVAKNMGKKINPIPDAQLDQAIFDHTNRVQMDFWMTAGRTEQERGQVERRKTMFESSQIEKYGQLRNQDNMSLVEDFAKDIGKKLLDQLQDNLRVPTAVEVIGEMGKNWKEGITKKEILGDMDVSIDIGSTSPKIPELEKKELVEFLDLISNIPGIENFLTMDIDSEISVGEFIKQLAKKYDIEEYDIIRKKTGKSQPLIQQSIGQQNLPTKTAKGGKRKSASI